VSEHQKFAHAGIELDRQLNEIRQDIALSVHHKQFEQFVRSINGRLDRMQARIDALLEKVEVDRE
jgi:hypothetical protein